MDIERLFGNDQQVNRKVLENRKERRKQRRNNQIVNYYEGRQQGYLEVENEMEKTLQYRQKDLQSMVPIQNKRNMFKLDLGRGDYVIDYSRDGRFVAMASSIGHISLIRMESKEIVTEFRVNEKLRDVKFLINEGLYSVAQQKYTYFYDNQGVEVHRLTQLDYPLFQEYLPYHYLLAQANSYNLMSWFDVTVGKMVANYQASNQSISAMGQNPANAIIVVGDNSGQVSFYSPNSAKPAVKVLANKGCISAVQVTNNGNYLISCGTDNQMKIWDIRKLEELYSYYTPFKVKQSAISQTNLMAISQGKEIMIWKDLALQKQKRPYIKEHLDKNVNSLRYQPYQDFLGVGLERGFQSMLVPGSGFAQYDSFEVNLFQSGKQKREGEIKKLLDKLPSSTIMMNTNMIGNIDYANKEVIEKEAREEEEKQEVIKKTKNKTRGKSKKQKRIVGKQFVHDEKTAEKLQEFLRNRKKIKKTERERQQAEMEQLEQLDMSNFNPLKVVKKIHK